MAKVSLTKLGLKVNQEIKTIEFNEQIIEVKQYLPISDKLELISNVINSAADENNFSNPVKIGVFSILEIFYAYTNINFTEKQKEDPAKLYDILISSGLVKEVIQAIPEAEYNEIMCGISDCVESIYSYKNSVLGILETISSDYNKVSFDAKDIQEKLSDPTNMMLLRDVLNKLG